MVDVTCAIIERAGMVLVALRGQDMHLAGLWEFPGGKLREGEAPEACIVREIKEELSLAISPGAALVPSVHRYPEKTIRLIPFVCSITPNEPNKEEATCELKLKEHSECRWLWPERLREVALCPADVPVVDSYLRHLSQTGQIR